MDLRQAFEIRLKRRGQILKDKTQDLTEHPDSEISDKGYSDYSDIEASPYREKCDINRRKRRRKYPRVDDYIDPNQKGNLFNNPDLSDPETDPDDIGNMDGQSNGRWPLKDLS